MPPIASGVLDAADKAKIKNIFDNVGHLTDSNAAAASRSVGLVRWRCVVYEGRGRVYTPDELMLFRRVSKERCCRFRRTVRTAESRLRMAQNLLACAATGERDLVELRLAALAEIQAAAA